MFCTETNQAYLPKDSKRGAGTAPKTNLDGTGQVLKNFVLQDNWEQF